ncbi:MAG: L-serine ammonia-lyase, iron-sulfur-dependent subunit beta [Lachnospiraceae bacterium]|nr:L-serine ammonia-lyase, iron-sulfur-dependent subunit beta [Lachnospiraceae bacterium]
MNLFDIIGPIMIGPSSSHTAGAVKIGNVARRLLGEDVKKAEIYFMGSFLSTGKGHGTDRAIVAGLLGLAVDDDGIPNSFEIAEKRKMKFTIKAGEDVEGHPNAVRMKLIGVSGRKIEVMGNSVGGGRIEICEMDGVETSFSAEAPTLIIQNEDKPGYVAEITPILVKEHVNIATMQLHRRKRGTIAVMVIECDQEIPDSCIKALKKLDGVLEVVYLSMRGLE